jgi:hypothetical protein
MSLGDFAKKESEGGEKAPDKKRALHRMGYRARKS